jgi:hypothetical protein
MKTTLILILLLLSTLPALSQHKVKIYLADTLLEYDIQDITSLSFDNNTYLSICRVYMADTTVRMVTFRISNITIDGGKNKDSLLIFNLTDVKDSFAISKIDSIKFSKGNTIQGNTYSNVSINFTGYLWLYHETSKIYNEGGSTITLKDTIVPYTTKSISISNNFSSRKNYPFPYGSACSYCLDIAPAGSIWLCSDNIYYEFVNYDDGTTSCSLSQIKLLIDTVNLKIDTLIYSASSSYDKTVGHHYYSHGGSEGLRLSNIPYVIQDDGKLVASINSLMASGIIYSNNYGESSNEGGSSHDTGSQFVSIDDSSPGCTITIEIKEQ